MGRKPAESRACGSPEGLTDNATGHTAHHPATGPAENTPNTPDVSDTPDILDMPDAPVSGPAESVSNGPGRRPVGRAPDRRRGWGPLGAALLAAMTVAQVVSGVRPETGGLTGVIVLLLAASALAFAAGAHGPRRAVAAFAAAATAGYAAEWVGVRTGLPFGEYDYTGVLWPQVGGVPVVVALAWGGMGLAAHATASATVPERTVVPGGPGAPGSTAASGGRARGGPAALRSRVGRIVAGAAALTAWDLFLDPQMTRLGLWTWDDPGPYRGIPVGNFAGWLLVSLVVMALIEAVVAGPAAGAPGLISIYTVMAVMETVGFAAVFDPPDPLVAAVGGVCMGAFAAAAWRRRERWGRGSRRLRGYAHGRGRRNAWRK